MTRKVSGRLHSSFPFPFPYRHPSARILDRFEEPEPFIFTHPPHSVIFASGSVMGPMSSSPHQLAPEGSHPPVATSPQTHGPLIPDRETLRASAHSLCRLPKYHISYYLLLVTYTTDTASKGVARKVICCVAIPIWEGVSH